jgi:hypothetical protein
MRDNNRYNFRFNGNSVGIRRAISTISLIFMCQSAEAASLSVSHEAKISYDFGNIRTPGWSWGALVNFVSNRSAAPLLLSFDEKGTQIQAFPFTVPDSEMVDLDDISRGPDGALAICGAAYDHAGRGSGFIATISPSGDQTTIVRLYPYRATRLAVASDGTIWTAGIEVVNGKETGPGVNPANGVIRHFDRTGKLLGSFIPRSSLPAPFMAEYGFLRAAKGRIGWYTGPIVGPGSEYYEILSDGTVRKYPSVALKQFEFVTGLALTDDGSSYITTSDTPNHTWRVLSVSSSDKPWTVQALPAQMSWPVVYGGEGSQLMFFSNDRFKITFVDAR